MREQTALTPTEGDALILVDLQRDFLPGGSLAVAEGDRVIPVLNHYIERFQAHDLPIFATRDWHPANHCSFQAQGGPWPPHCIQHSEGASWAPGLALPAAARIISKADSPAQDAYSGFQQTDLAHQLRQRGCKRLLIGGLATDYCVLNTVLDALKEGFEVLLLTDGIRAVNVQPDDGARAIERMQTAGARPIELTDLNNATP
ncbi:bifunctional nicotinamidase/pyrazinamidase [Marinobacterium arenosum]|uniref:bifunctional nicotinamidase/pyrazinamidase n=1 Tax=Marinobacterium arenosum TaxID=2862496 RepID=UPI001C98CF71|nr:bifunctional nicotinamidase/pyrazinamidase [Marinobacterium arenosum]MBY4676829.1 bifunctional nicotinamidase/pyrazinamidase [Marinobacterium arenosum]